MNASIPAGRKRFGPFSVDPRSGELYRNNVKVKLQRQPFQVLMLLLEKPGEIVSHGDIKRRLWPGEQSGAFDDRIHAAIRGIRYALGDPADHPMYIEMLPKQGYRFIAPVEEVVEEPVGKSTANLRKPLAWIVFTLSMISAIAWYHGRHFRPHRPPTLTDTVVLIDFANSTGDAVFDDTLQTALSVSLRQSPFLTVLSDRDVTRTLQEMTLPAGTKLTPEQA